MHSFAPLRCACMYVATLTVMFAPHCQAIGQIFLGLGDLPGGKTSSSAPSISADGSTVVGVSHSGSGREAFYWTAQHGLVGLGDLPGGQFGSQALGVNADGSVVVGRSVSASGPEAFRWTPKGGMQGLGDLPGGVFKSTATAVSGDGSVIVGQGASIRSGGHGEAMRWTAEKGMVGLGFFSIPEDGTAWSCPTAVSDDGAIVIGYGQRLPAKGTGGPYKAFSWAEKDGMRSLSDISMFGAFDITPDGRWIVGGSLLKSHSRPFFNQGVRAYRVSAAGDFEDLGKLEGKSPDATAYAVSRDGQIIVGNIETFNGLVAFIWDKQHGMRDLKSLLVQEFGMKRALEGWQMTYAADISEAGSSIVGVGINPYGDREAWLVRFPKLEL